MTSQIDDEIFLATAWTRMLLGVTKITFSGLRQLMIQWVEGHRELVELCLRFKARINFSVLFADLPLIVSRHPDLHFEVTRPDGKRLLVSQCYDRETKWNFLQIFTPK